MPFDGTNGTLAAKMREILNRGWCKYSLREEAGGHCLMGALLEARWTGVDAFVAKRHSCAYDEEMNLYVPYNKDPALIALSEAVATVSPYHKRLHKGNHWSRVAKFNNDSSTSFEDILKVLDVFEAKEIEHVA